MICSLKIVYDDIFIWAILCQGPERQASYHCGRRFLPPTSSGPVIDLLFKKVIEAGNPKKDSILLKYLNFNLKHVKEHSFANLLRIEVHS